MSSEWDLWIILVFHFLKARRSPFIAKWCLFSFRGEVRDRIIAYGKIEICAEKMKLSEPPVFLFWGNVTCSVSDYLAR
jgi:hypothetical protein